MARTKKEAKVLTPEEKMKNERDRGLRDIQDVLPHLNEPTYHFNVGDKVRFGAIKEATIDEVFYDGKVYGMKCIATECNYGNPYDYETYRVRPWMDIRPLEFGDTEFAKNQDIRLRFNHSTIESLIFKYYSFGIDMDPEYQRDYVWGTEDKELLIDSIFNNIDIGKFVLVERDDWTVSDLHYEILDGKQRLSALIEFYENRLSYKGKLFNELSAKDQNVFKGHNISVAELRGMDKKEVLNHFLILNRTGRTMDKSHLDKVQEMIAEMK